VCWDLLAILREGDPDLMQVRGCHATISPVHLPDFLPLEVVQAMVEKYRHYLHRELEKLMGRIVAPTKTLTHARTYSGESRSGLSDVSIASGQFVTEPIQ
jgi:hypothetical protein